VQKYEDAKLTEDRAATSVQPLKQTDLQPLFKQLKDQQAAHKVNEQEKRLVLKNWNAMVLQGFEA
jgi:hypothetical protein